MTSTTDGFAPHHPWDRAFFALFLLACWIGVVAGFFPASSARLAGHADYPAPWFLHLHAAAFVGWMILLSAQILLIAANRTAAHRRLGLVGVLLVPLMAATAVTSEFYSQRFYMPSDPGNLQFFALPLLYIAGFVAFATAALIYARRDSPTHKRLILLATSIIVGAAYARWWGEGLTAMIGDGFWGMLVNTYTGANLIMAAAIAYDLVTRRRVHRAYLIGVPVILGVQLLASWAYHSPWWGKLSRALVESDFLRFS